MMLSGLPRLQCRRIRPALWDYVAERLSEGPLETVERHLAVCAACRRETESLRSAQGLLAACRQTPIPPPRSDWNALRSRLQLEGRPSESGGRAHLPRPSARRMRRSLPRQRNRWLPSLAASTACATMLLLIAFGYRSLHTAAPVRKGIGTQSLSAGRDRAAAAQDVVVTDSTAGHRHASDRDDTDPGYDSLDNAALWMDPAPTHSHSVQPVVASVRHSEPLHRAIPAADREQSRQAIAGNGQPLRQSHVSDARQPKSDRPHFRPYKLRPEDALPQNNAEENHYAIDSVAPIGGSGAYLMPSVRPVQYNGNEPY